MAGSPHPCQYTNTQPSSHQGLTWAAAWMLVRLNSGPKRAGRLPSASPIFHEGAVRLSPRPGWGQWKQPGTGWNWETTSAPHHLGLQEVSSPLRAPVFSTKPGINIPLLPSLVSWEGQLRQWMFNALESHKSLVNNFVESALLRNSWTEESSLWTCGALRLWISASSAKHCDVFGKSYTTLCKLSFLQCKLSSAFYNAKYLERIISFGNSKILCKL